MSSLLSYLINIFLKELQSSLSEEEDYFHGGKQS